MTNYEPATTLTIQLYWSTSLLDAAVFDKLWARARALPIPATWFGTHKPFKHRISTETPSAFQLFSFERAILFGDKKRVDGAIRRHVDGFGEETVFASVPTWDARWTEWICDLCSEVPILFGRACSLLDYQRKHAVTTEYQQGRRHSAVGMSRPELYQYLPGVYWMTLLGPELTGALDVASAAAIPGVVVHKLAGNQCAVLASATPFDDNDVRSQRERDIANALGDDHFFDRERMGRALRPVPAFADALTMMKGHAYD